MDILIKAPLLSAVIWTPIVAGVLLLALGHTARMRWVALAGALLGFALSLPLFSEFNALSGGLQFEEKHAWIESWRIFYHLGVDGISMPFVVLNSLITVLVIIAGWDSVKDRQAQYFAAFLIMSGLINGAFAAQDAVLFYVFFEAMLIPMYLIIGLWGGPRRVYAALKFFLFTLLGSLLLLVAFLFLHLKTGSFSIHDFHLYGGLDPVSGAPLLGLTAQKWLFIAFFLAFAVKVPMVPVHTWLPDAHVEAPTGGSVVLAAITLKLGAYGFLRFCLPIVPDASLALAPWVVGLSLIAITYIGFVALVQADMKKLIAYSSISHMGFVTLGFFLFALMGEGRLLTQEGLEGGLVQMISHGFVSAAMFLCVGVMYDRLHSRQIADYGGVANVMPKFAAFFVLFAMANAGLPATSGFIGEFLVILGAAKTQFWIAFIAATSLILGAAYTLWMVKRVVFGEVVHEAVKSMPDLTRKEFGVLAVLAIAVLGMGLNPEPFVSRMHITVNDLVRHVANGKVYKDAQGLPTDQAPAAQGQ